MMLCMHTKQSLLVDLKALGLDSEGTTLAHFSYKSLGEVEGGAQTVVDAMVEYMHDGLMVFPTHTWANVNDDQPYYSVNETEVCIGIIPELARKTPNGITLGTPDPFAGRLRQGCKNLHRGRPLVYHSLPS
jgi:aminoglycoside 3-N-acetyltransferase